MQTHACDPEPRLSILCSMNDLRKVCRSHCHLCSKSTSARPGAATFAQPATEALGQGSWHTLEGAQTCRISLLIASYQPRCEVL